jgi:hypothetical protein
MTTGAFYRELAPASRLPENARDGNFVLCGILGGFQSEFERARNSQGQI